EVTGAFDRVTEKALGARKASDEAGTGAQRRQLARVALPSMSASAFLANTPLVGMLAPRIVAWCRRTGRSPSRYLMPLSYAVIFGGCITLIGTSTNLVVSDLLTDAGMPALDVFEITPIGLPVALIGVGLIIMLAPRLLPRRESPVEDLGENLREFTVEMLVPADSPLAGKTVEDAGLRNLEGVYLIEIERSGRVVAPVAPFLVLQEGDRLVFAGNVGRVLDLERIQGLVSAQERHFSSVQGDRQFHEAVVAEGSPLVGQTVKASGFRGRYGAAVVAIHRAGSRVPGKLGDVRLLQGDVLLVLAGADFAVRWRDSQDFLLVATLGENRPLRREKARIVQLLAVGLVVTAGTGLLDLLQVSLLVAIALIATRCLTTTEARNAIDLEVILLMASSFGLGIALQETGLADQVAAIIVAVSDTFGDIGILAGILIATMLMTELLSNNAAAVLMFPIAMATAERTGMAPRPLAVIILFGATLSFLTPIGYQTNTMIWGMGGYRYRDFSRLGAPLTLATLIALVTITPLYLALR
ncbi:MAG: SLC13 family permease, partial [Actinomycetota bacterium]